MFPRKYFLTIIMTFRGLTLRREICAQKGCVVTIMFECPNSFDNEVVGWYKPCYFSIIKYPVIIMI